MNVRNLVQIGRGPLGTVFCCPYCRKAEMIRNGLGRGYHLAARSTAWATIVSHIKASHADKLELMEKMK